MRIGGVIGCGLRAARVQVRVVCGGGSRHNLEAANETVWANGGDSRSSLEAAGEMVQADVSSPGW